MRLHLFNPDNDLALATGGGSYTPTRAVRAFVEAGAMLPLWWADADDAVVGSDDTGRRWMRDTWGLQCAGHPHEATEGAPWGWSAEAVRRLRRAGMSETLLPSEWQIEQIQELSHRRNTIALAEALGVEPPRECFSLDEVPEDAVVKAPWSSSGKGVLFTSRMSRAEACQRIERIIARQGSVLAEKERCGVLDFALLFDIDGPRTRCTGVSVFATDPRGTYTGNIVASQASLRAMLPTEVERCERVLPALLADLIGDGYRGPAGVDMQVTDCGVYPCVELNLRRTMGFVARDVYERTRIPGVALGPVATASLTDSHILLTPPGREVAIAYRRES